MKPPFDRLARCGPEALTTRSRRTRNCAIALLLACFTLVLYACGGGDGVGAVTSDGGGDSGMSAAAGDAGMGDAAGDATGPSFTISGTASGLAGAGLTLQNGAETLAVNANGAFA